MNGSAGKIQPHSSPCERDERIVPAHGDAQIQHDIVLAEFLSQGGHHEAFRWLGEVREIRRQEALAHAVSKDGGFESSAGTKGVAREGF